MLDPSQINKLIQAMEQTGIGTTDIENILWRNAKRVLECGWDAPDLPAKTIKRAI